MTLCPGASSRKFKFSKPKTPGPCRFQLGLGVDFAWETLKKYHSETELRLGVRPRLGHWQPEPVRKMEQYGGSRSVRLGSDLSVVAGTPLALRLTEVTAVSWYNLSYGHDHRQKSSS